VMHDPRMPGFPREMVTSSGVLLATAIQLAAREMTRRIIAWFWNPKFMTNEYRLIAKAIFPTEDAMATHSAIAKAPYRVQGQHQLLISTTGSYLFHMDSLLRSLEKEYHTMQDGFASCAWRNQTLEEDIHREADDARCAREDQIMLAQKLNNEIAQRLTVKIKLAKAETELAKLKAQQIEMKCKEGAYNAAMELVQNQAHHNLKVRIGSDPIGVNKIQECQPAIGKEDSSLTLTEPQLKECIHENLPSLNGTEEEPWTSTNDWTFPEGYLRKDQMWPPWKKPRHSKE